MRPLVYAYSERDPRIRRLSSIGLRTWLALVAETANTASNEIAITDALALVGSVVFTTLVDAELIADATLQDHADHVALLARGDLWELE